MGTDGEAEDPQISWNPRRREAVEREKDTRESSLRGESEERGSFERKNQQPRVESSAVVARAGAARDEDVLRRGGGWGAGGLGAGDGRVDLSIGRLLGPHPRSARPLARIARAHHVERLPA
eukprot:scaffold91071_cov33-Tisochrysis_lutea.AAC.1